jgi:hypothetical protein
MDKENVVHIYNKIVFCFKKEILSFLTKMGRLDNILLSGISHEKKDKYCLFSLYVGSKIIKHTEQRGRIVMSRGWGLGRGRDDSQRVQNLR